jgi:hypothetical protein
VNVAVAQVRVHLSRHHPRQDVDRLLRVLDLGFHRYALHGKMVKLIVSVWLVVVDNLTNGVGGTGNGTQTGP